MLLLQIFAALATGGAIVWSQYLGKEDPDNAGLAAKQLVLVTTLLSVVIMAVCLVFCHGILRGIYGQLDADVMSGSQTYFFLTAISYPFIALYNAGAALFRAQGNSRVSMFTSLLMNAINISGNAVLIYGFSWGVAGAATATLVSRIIGAAVMIWLLCHGSGFLSGDTLFHFNWQSGMVKNILRVGIPSGLENGMFHIGKLLVQGLIASFGTMAIAANAMTNSVTGFVNVPGNAIGLALITVVGQCVGAGDFDAAKKYILKLTGLAYLCAWALSFALFFADGPLTHLFGLSPETARLAEEVINTFCIATVFFWPGAFTVPNGLRAAGDVRFTMLVSVMSMWVFRIGCSYLFCRAFDLGLVGVWLAMYVDWIVRMIVFGVRLFRGGWKNRQVV